MATTIAFIMPSSSPICGQLGSVLSLTPGYRAVLGLLLTFPILERTGSPGHILMVTIEAQEDRPNQTNISSFCLHPVTGPNPTSLGAGKYSPHLLRGKGHRYREGEKKNWEQVCNLPYRLFFDFVLYSNATWYQLFPSEACKHP